MKVNRKRKSDKCTVCQTTLNGRKDQVFCGRDCQNLHHKETKAAIHYLKRCRDKRIRRNCIILEGVVTDRIKKVKIHRDTLFEHGFDINSFEHESWKGNKRIRYLGPFAFWLLKNGMICIKKRKKSCISNPIILKRWQVEFYWLRCENEVIDFNVEQKENTVIMDVLTVLPFIYCVSRTKALYFNKINST